MGRELWLNFAGRPECRFIQCAEILAHGTRRICRIDARCVPLFLWRRVLLVGIGFDQAGINGHTLAADQASSMHRATVVSNRCRNSSLSRK